MKKRSRLFALLTAAALACSVFASGCDSESGKIKVAIVQPMSHTSLDQIRDTIVAEIEASGRDDIEIVTENANNDTSALTTIMQNLRSEGVDIVVPIATGTAQSAKAVFEGDDTPIIFSAVSDPDAAGLTGSDCENITGVSNNIVRGIMSLRIAKGRPWMVSFLFFTAAYAVGALVSMTPACLIVWAFFQKFAKEMNYKKGDKYVSFMIVGIALAGLMGFTLFNFRVPGSILIGYIEAAGGYVSFVGYSVTAFIVGYGALIFYTILGKFVVRPDVERIKSGYKFEGGEKMSSYQKQLLGITIALIVVFIIQSLFSTSVVGQFLTQLGTSGIVLVFLLVMGFIKRKDGSFFADLLDGTKNGVPWPVFYLLTIGMPLAFAMTDESLGIQPMLSGAFDKILGGGVSGLFVFVIFITFLSAFSTQFLLNQIPGMVIFPIASAYCATLNVNPGMLACMITICANSSIILPSANPIAGVMHGMSDWISPKEIYKYSIPLVISVWLLSVVVWLVFGNFFFNLFG